MRVAYTNAVIVAVEDNADNLFIVTEILRTKLNIQTIYGHTSGQEFFTFLEQHPTVRPDLILLDLQLPQENGYTVLRKIRNYEQLDDTRVLAVTANVMVDDVLRARAAEFDGFIGKPIDRSRFPNQILRALRGEAVWEPR